jgi:hypothetical protein
LFLLKSNILYRKMNTAIHRNFACIQPAFVANRTQLTGKPIATFERSGNFILETTLRSDIYLKLLI